jgi:hypothetical protein
MHTIKNIVKKAARGTISANKGNAGETSKSSKHALGVPSADTNKMPQRDPFHLLVDELVGTILVHLPATALSQLALVNRRLHKLALDPQLVRTRQRAIPQLDSFRQPASEAHSSRSRRAIATFEAHAVDAAIPFVVAERAWGDTFHFFDTTTVLSLPSLGLMTQVTPSDVDGSRPDLAEYATYLASRADSRKRPVAQIQLAESTSEQRPHVVCLVAWQDDKVKIFHAPLVAEDRGDAGTRFRAKPLKLAHAIGTFVQDEVKAVRVLIKDKPVVVGVLSRTGLDAYTYWPATHPVDTSSRYKDIFSSARFWRPAMRRIAP